MTDASTSRKPFSPPIASDSVVALSIAGLLAFAAAMGVGRFAATPLLPLMQQDGSLGLAEGAWLATANYAGYLVGALLSLVITGAPSRIVGGGLAAVMASTAAMVVTDNVVVWYLLRFIAGVASALVLVGVSGTALSVIGASTRPELTGIVFAGVGVGSCVAGLVAMLAAVTGAGARAAWFVLAVVVLAVLIGGRRTWVAADALAARRRAETAASDDRAGPSRSPGADRQGTYPDGLGLDAWVLVFAYGVFGLGYIVPATFLPAMARELVADPRVYGWLWPLFGLAAALSTIVTTWYFRRTPPQTIFVASLVVMAIGVGLPVIQRSAVTLVLSALLVGGTFMVATMAGLWRAGRLVRGAPYRLIGLMTAAFATGQLLGPALVAAGTGSRDPIAIPSLVSCALLLGSAALVGFRHRPPRRRAAGPRFPMN